MYLWHLFLYICIQQREGWRNPHPFDHDASLPLLRFTHWPKPPARAEEALIVSQCRTGRRKRRPPEANPDPSTNKDTVPIHASLLEVAPSHFQSSAHSRLEASEICFLVFLPKGMLVKSSTAYVAYWSKISALCWNQPVHITSRKCNSSL
ncbi:uncharacterized protein LOC127795355 isoform X4 [Diospyros lotus]|uniref:uncharacterized protein LOC127795355 isoform X4 n=1 Tax=Diospyros lotus TaxID=55363 RepID=UPI00225BB8EE|nr:uncharacterized protein LOC127795355 isoform X4 [Diospyros lotus]